MAETIRKTWRQARELLESADRGAIPYEIGTPWKYCGLPTYKVAGWEFAIFDDCGEWDYVEWIQPPGRERITAGPGDGLHDFWGYRPTGELARSYELQMQIVAR